MLLHLLTYPPPISLFLTHPQAQARVPKATKRTVKARRRWRRSGRSPRRATAPSSSPWPPRCCSRRRPRPAAAQSKARASRSGSAGAHRRQSRRWRRRRQRRVGGDRSQLQRRGPGCARIGAPACVAPLGLARLPKPRLQPLGLPPQCNALCLSSTNQDSRLLVDSAITHITLSIRCMPSDPIAFAVRFPLLGSLTLTTGGMSYALLRPAHFAFAALIRRLFLETPLPARLTRLVTSLAARATSATGTG